MVIERMKKLLLILLCMLMIYSCGEVKKEKEEGNLSKEITEEMIVNGYTGKGTITWEGNKYIGEWKDGNCHGQGTMIYANGTVYKGLWKDGKVMSEYH